MPNIAQELCILSGARFYARFELSHSYWQLELEPESWRLQSFINLDGIFSPMRVIHGTKNAVSHLQSALSAVIPDDSRSSLLVWLDDTFLYNRNIFGLLKSVASRLRFCTQYKIRLHLGKCVLFAKEIRWCGRIISDAGIRYDPRRLDGILKMYSPLTGAHPQQFLCALHWVRNGIQEVLDLISFLLVSMEKPYHPAGKRTKLSVSGCKLAGLGWSDPELRSLNACKHVLTHQVTLSHLNAKKRMCFYTNASDGIWTSIATQVHVED